MTDDQLRALVSLDAPPDGIDVFVWWEAPFWLYDVPAQKIASLEKKEVQLDFFEATTSEDKNF